MSLDEILALISELKIERESEQVSLQDALWRVLSADIKARRDLPSFDNSALDGYAFAYRDRHQPLKVRGNVLAGDTNEYEIKQGECYKIMTGAAFVKGSDTLVALEHVKFNEKGELLVSADIRKDNARKLKGEEIGQGDMLFSAHKCLRPADITMLAAQGINQIKVYKRPKISVLCTGSEIKEPGELASAKQIYNANASAILSLLRANNYSANYEGIIKDDKEHLKKALSKASANADIIVTSGGASKGDADYMADALSELSFEVVFNGIAFRPASPTKLYEKDGVFVLVAPGNPLSYYVACYFVLLTLIRHFEGFDDALPSFQLATLANELHFKAGRDNLIIGTYENGIFSPYNNGKFSPSQILPLVKSNAFSVAKADVSVLTSGSQIKIYEIL